MLVCEFNARIYICPRAAGWLQCFEPNYKGHVDIYIYSYKSIFFFGFAAFRGTPLNPSQIIADFMLF